MHPGIETLRAIEELSSPSKAFKSIDKLSSPFLSLTPCFSTVQFPVFLQIWAQGHTTGVRFGRRMEKKKNTDDGVDVDIQSDEGEDEFAEG